MTALRKAEILDVWLPWNLWSELKSHKSNPLDFLKETYKFSCNMIRWQPRGIKAKTGRYTGFYSHTCANTNTFCLLTP